MEVGKTPVVGPGGGSFTSGLVCRGGLGKGPGVTDGRPREVGVSRGERECENVRTRGRGT